MPRLKALRLSKMLGSAGATSSGYDGLESGDGPHAGSAVGEGDKAAIFTSPGSSLERSGDGVLLSSSLSDERRSRDADAADACCSSDVQAKTEKSKKAKKALGAKLRLGKAKIGTWEYSDCHALRSPTSPSADASGQTFAGPAVASPASGDDGTRPTDVTQASTALNLGRSSNGSRGANCVTPLFVAYRNGAEQQGCVPATGNDDTGDAITSGTMSSRANGWTSASCAPADSRPSREANKTATAPQPGDRELAQSKDEKSQRQQQQPEQQQTTGKKERKLKLKLNLKTSIRKISADLARALKRSDGLNAQVTLMSPPASGGDTPTSPTPATVVVVKAASFKGVGGSVVGGDDAERRLHVSSRQLGSAGSGAGRGYSALSASCGSRGDDDDDRLSSAGDDDDQDDVDEVSSPHDISVGSSSSSRFAISARVPLRDNGFRPL